MKTFMFVRSAYCQNRIDQIIRISLGKQIVRCLSKFMYVCMFILFVTDFFVYVHMLKPFMFELSIIAVIGS